VPPAALPSARHQLLRYLPACRRSGRRCSPTGKAILEVVRFFLLAPALAAKVAPNDTCSFLRTRRKARACPWQSFAPQGLRAAQQFVWTTPSGWPRGPALSAAPKVKIEARISKSGQAQPSSGDMRGESASWRGAGNVESSSTTFSPERCKCGCAQTGATRITGNREPLEDPRRGRWAGRSDTHQTVHTGKGAVPDAAVNSLSSGDELEPIPLPCHAAGVPVFRPPPSPRRERARRSRSAASFGLPYIPLMIMEQQQLITKHAVKLGVGEVKDEMVRLWGTSTATPTDCCRGTSTFPRPASPWS